MYVMPSETIHCERTEIKITKLVMQTFYVTKDGLNFATSMF